ncbi:aquaporin AQPAn.G-like isoform X2 [Mya arenaria]|uniref:aquaporin AQPAn.G-like isoform X2 n=1 Tax=Mya arenaria TaxID=6604 RepID=UPI0022E6C10C|nr:aquaporin AQPAn.G-like isoform X2 [Mya arenaria]
MTRDVAAFEVADAPSDEYSTYSPLLALTDNGSTSSQVWIHMSGKRATEISNVSRISDDDSEGCCYMLRMATSIEDIRSPFFWKAVFAEFIGTFILVLTAIGSTVQGWHDDPLDVVQIALSFGLCVATSVWIVGHVSGGHINPAVTCAMLITRRVSLIRAIMFIIAQCLGSIAGAGLLKALTPSAQWGGLGTTTLNEGMTPAMGFGVECFITMFLVLTVFAACDTKRTDLGGSFPLSIGFSVTMGHLWAVEYCGSSMNPARSLGPAVVMDIWDDHWLYWVGPITGGVIAGLIYDNVFAANASLRKARDLMMSAKFEDEKYPAKKPVVRVLDDEYEAEAMTNTV